MTPRDLSTSPRLAIVNPTTLVGTEIRTILRERAFPFERVALLDSTGTAGTLTKVGDEPAVVSAISEAELTDLDLVFFCGPAEKNRDWIEKHAELGFTVIDLSQPTSAENGRLVVAGINLEELNTRGDVLVSPHPVGIPIALILHRVAAVAPIELATASVVQPASEFEQAGVEELAAQTISVLNVHGVPKEVFDRQLAFNLYPALEHREEFIVSQIRSLTAPRANLALFVTQGTIFHGHTFSLFVKSSEPIDRQSIVESLSKSPAIALPVDDEQFATIDAAGRDEVLVAEVRPDPSIPGSVWIWAACDNLRRSSALNAVLVAEKVLFGTATN